MHKCQGMSQLVALPGSSSANYELVEAAIPGQMQKAERSLFDAVDTTIAGLAQLSGVRPARELTSGLAAIASLQVTPVATSRLLVANFPTPVSAGAPETFTVTAQDPYGNVTPAYTGTDHFTSTDARAVLPADYAFQSTDVGIQTFTGTLNTVGTWAEKRGLATVPRS